MNFQKKIINKQINFFNNDTVNIAWLWWNHTHTQAKKSHLKGFMRIEIHAWENNFDFSPTFCGCWRIKSRTKILSHSTKLKYCFYEWIRDCKGGNSKKILHERHFLKNSFTYWKGFENFYFILKSTFARNLLNKLNKIGVMTHVLFRFQFTIQKRLFIQIYFLFKSRKYSLNWHFIAAVLW